MEARNLSKYIFSYRLFHIPKGSTAYRFVKNMQIAAFLTGKNPISNFFTNFIFLRYLLMRLISILLICLSMSASLRAQTKVQNPGPQSRTANNDTTAMDNTENIYSIKQHFLYN